MTYMLFNPQLLNENEKKEEIIFLRPFSVSWKTNKQKKANKELCLKRHDFTIRSFFY